MNSTRKHFTFFIRLKQSVSFKMDCIHSVPCDSSEICNYFNTITPLFYKFVVKKKNKPTANDRKIKTKIKKTYPACISVSLVPYANANHSYSNEY